MKGEKKRGTETRVLCSISNKEQREVKIDQSRKRKGRKVNERVSKMKILRSNIDRHSGEGDVRLEAEEEDDMYHLYNLISEGDRVQASTIRMVSYSLRDS